MIDTGNTDAMEYPSIEANQSVQRTVSFVDYDRRHSITSRDMESTAANMNANHHPKAPRNRL